MNKILNNNLSLPEKKVLAVFSASWCGPCKMLSLETKKLDEKGTIDIYYIDIDLNEELTEKYEIHSVPTLIIFENGNETKRISGYMRLNELEEWIDSE